MVRVVLLCSLTLQLVSEPLPDATAKVEPVVTAAQINGTWSNKSGEFKIWALGNQKLRVEFSGSYEYGSASGPVANTGEANGIATIERSTAIFTPQRSGADGCKITMKFEIPTLVVTQDGSCGFGLNVTAAGRYRRSSKRKPAFDHPDPMARKNTL